MDSDGKRITVTKSSMPPLEEYIAEIAPLWRSHWLTNMGEKHSEFERQLKKRLRVNNIALFTNGHAALECVFEAMELRGKVITTPFTFASTVHAIVRKGLEPVFADINPNNFTINPESVERLIDDDTCAIVPVHVYGNLCDINAIDQLASDRGIRVIYDAAHAFGVERFDPISNKWRNVASDGDASMFSFHATKAFNTIEGGAVCFRDAKLKPILDQWKNFGITGPESVEYVGSNAKMNEFCAAMGICNLRHFDEEIGKRRRIAERYWELLSDVRGILLCKPNDNVRYNYAYLPVVFDDSFGATRDEVFNTLANEGIGARKYFFPLVSDYDCYRERFDSSATPIAKWVSQRVLTLPLYADLEIHDVDQICRIVRSCAR